MGKVIYSMNVSLDGYVETPDHSLDWALVDDDLHGWWNEQMRRADAVVWGRRIFELMAAYWPTAPSDPEATPAMLEFARIVNPKPKVVFSTTLREVGWNGRLASGDVGEALARLRNEFEGDLDVAGPRLAHQFVRRGLVDEYRLMVHPVILGAGTPFFPRLDAPLRLRQTEVHRFASGVVLLGYSAAS
jgi:dihydrofolate reductase